MLALQKSSLKRRKPITVPIKLTTRYSIQITARLNYTIARSHLDFFFCLL